MTHTAQRDAGSCTSSLLIAECWGVVGKKKNVTEVGRANGWQIIGGSKTELLNAQTQTCCLLAAAGMDTRQNRKLGGRSHVLLHMGQLDWENGRPGKREEGREDAG